MKKWVSLPQKRQLGPHKDKHTHTHMRTHTHTNTALVNSYKGLIFRLYWSGHNLLSNATPLLRPRSDFIMCLVSTALFHYILLNGFCHPTHSHWPEIHPWFNISRIHFWTLPNVVLRSVFCLCASRGCVRRQRAENILVQCHDSSLWSAVRKWHHLLENNRKYFSREEIVPDILPMLKNTWQLWEIGTGSHNNAKLGSTNKLAKVL